MYAVLLTLALVANQEQTGRDATTQPQTGRDRDTAAMPSLDGTWKVLCLEKDGQPVSKAKDATVTIQNNLVTFKGQEGHLKTMRLEFGPQGTIRVTEMEGDHSSGTSGRETRGSGDRNTGGTTGGTGTGDRTTGARTGGEHDQHGPKSGVYVFTKDYFCVCLHPADQYGAGAARQGTTTGRETGSTGTTGSGSTTGGTQGRISGYGLGKPSAHNSVVLILHRGGSGSGDSSR